MTKSFNMRWAIIDDYPSIGEVMYDAVRSGKSKYSDAQRSAWMPEARSGDEWNIRLAQQDIILCEDNTQIVGFMSLAPKAYIDFAFIRPSAQGRGLFRKLYNEIENLAQKHNEPRLWVHASLMAQPAFSAVGFTIIKEETVAMRGQDFNRFEMEKNLAI